MIKVKFITIFVFYAITRARMYFEIVRIIP